MEGLPRPCSRSLTHNHQREETGKSRAISADAGTPADVNGCRALICRPYGLLAALSGASVRQAADITDRDQA